MEILDFELVVFIRLLKDILVEGCGVDLDGVMDGWESDIVILWWVDVKILVENGSVELVWFWKCLRGGSIVWMYVLCGGDFVIF